MLRRNFEKPAGHPGGAPPVTTAKHNALYLGNPDALERAYPPALRREIAERVNVLGARGTDHWTQDQSALAEADVILSTWGMPRLDAEFLAHAPRLKAVFYAAGAIKGFATPEAFERGIVFSSAWTANAIPVSEYAAATALLSLKRFWAAAGACRTQRDWSERIETPGCYHSTVGFVSFGATGRKTADILSRFDLHLIAFDPFVHADNRVKFVSLEEVFDRSDVVSIHAPWLPETEKMVTAALLRRMKPNATLINTSRGAVIDEPGLCAVLAERPDLTAVLDVTDPEPPAPDSPLFTLPNVVLTPHIAGSIGGEVERMGRLMCDELSSFLAGEPLRNRVTLDMLDRMA